MTTELANWLIRMREERGWKQSEFADRAGVTRQDMNAMEKGRIALPGAEKRRKLANALGVRHVDLLMAIGELSPDEIDPQRSVRFGDNRLQAIADNWDQLTEKEKDFLLLILEGNRRRRGHSQAGR